MNSQALKVDSPAVPDDMTTVADRLIASRQTLAVMESCTGGLLTSTITRTEGCGEFFPGGVVSYATEAKVALGVSSTVIEKFGVVSKETAREMAVAIRRLLNADIGVGITGVAGPSTQEGVEPGTVFIAIASDRTAQARELQIGGEPDEVKEATVAEVLRWLAQEYPLSDD